MVRHLLAGLLLLGAAGPALAQDPALAGVTITAVHVEIEGRRDPAVDLRTLIETRAGAPLDPQLARESIAQLFAVGRFDDVRIEAVREPGGIALVYRLTPRHPITRIEVRGDTGLPEATLRDALEARFEGLAAPPPGDEAAQAVMALLRDEGYLAARVTARAGVRHAPHDTTLTFDVHAGDPAPIGAASVEGTWPEAPDALLA
nr:hypothetical protein [Acidobacteriota bacterium]